MKRKIYQVIGGLFLLLVVLTTAFSNGEIKTALGQEKPPAVKSPSAIVIDSQDLSIIYEKNAAAVSSIASLSKILLAYVVFDQIEQGHLTWNDSFQLSEYGREIGSNAELSNVSMDASRRYTVKELMQGVLIASANNCAITLAEGISGSEENCVELLQTYLDQWGIESDQLVNVTGLDPEYIPDNRTGGNTYNMLSAYDLAQAATRLIRDFPSVLAITKQEGLTFSGVYIESYNKLLPGKRYEYPGVDGLKTGTTDSAGACLISTCKKNEQRVITVVLGAESDKERYSDTTRLLDYAFGKECEG